ncbi:MAG: Glycosyltransferase involved in cell wall bisynthesis [Chloroflexi bacterium AL-W]|nr:Glycosyltransferase involved in cell wall bisynthesis [Chloroflexi bacterium AL-N1]NOK68942.1 Glycosyltransferase involved in cell wall bisynthesis [Chloroflexi bacterium AL-N10]NOK76925.1 Glycosyltransferase involved in cell wall bisynthesis [Chloroflexi bacterium AL-N5]NOK82687.1 Glycosyltransferase involved in cell wall bisynthesis [Chloroflexi bacterium AL-W]NOK90782.1 Glycosyltransferase involved in cell wall bisynthesis [Chloroflexi bacterium AL-N15]
MNRYVSMHQHTHVIRKLIQRTRHILVHEGWKGVYQKVWQKVFPSKIHRFTRTETYTSQAFTLAQKYDFSHNDLQQNNLVTSYTGIVDVKQVHWFLPPFEHAHYGGIYTILRFAAGFATTYAVQNTFVIVTDSTEMTATHYLERICQAFPALSKAHVVITNTTDHYTDIPPADVCIASAWTTAYPTLRFNNTKRKCYFIQDFEPLFFPAGSISAQAEATYRFGFYGLTNTTTLQQTYERDYEGRALAFHPCVDTHLFHPQTDNLTPIHETMPYRVFFYARPDYPRNGFELGATAMRRLKHHFGNRIQIISAGQHWQPKDVGLQGIVENRGLLSYEETAQLYRTCDVGLVMMFTRHPSYLPFELMASGCLVVSNVNQANIWFLKNEENCLLTPSSATCIAETITHALEDNSLRQRITTTAHHLINNQYTDWDEQIARIYNYICNPKDI